ncbi:MAG: hypothetical protein IKA96_01700, partial [Alistipes sp.]|nr:hypothetical protein [Alistipes sp.]
VVVFVASCDGNSQSEKQTQQKVEVMTPWQESLSAFMKNPMMNGDLLLCGYTMMGNLDSKESIQNYLDKCFDSKSYFLMFNSEWENKRDLGVQSDLASRNKFDESLFALHKEYVRGLLVGDGMSVVELRWSYKGKEFNTFAAVTNNEATPICYDNILTPYDPMTFKSVETRSIKGSGPTIIRGARPNIITKK